MTNISPKPTGRAAARQALVISSAGVCTKTSSDWRVAAAALVVAALVAVALILLEPVLRTLGNWKSARSRPAGRRRARRW
jgi:hypothetical protein